ncbi:MAG: HU family DNA-binding protein [Clostridia bacterium]|nr:HU family DNA-binding protein [Clostridia bacterium]
MNKQDIINEIKNQTKLTKRECNDAINAFLNVIKDGLNKGEYIGLSGLGKWYVQQYGAKYMYNPVTKKHYYTKPKKVPVFKAGNKFKTCIK